MSIWHHLCIVVRTYIALQQHSRCTSMSFQTLCARINCMTALSMLFSAARWWIADCSSWSVLCRNCRFPTSGILEVGMITLCSLLHFTLVNEYKKKVSLWIWSLHSSSVFILAVLYLCQSLKHIFSYGYFMKLDVSNSTDCHHFYQTVMRTMVSGHITFLLSILF